MKDAVLGKGYWSLSSTLPKMSRHEFKFVDECLVPEMFLLGTLPDDIPEKISANRKFVPTNIMFNGWPVWTNNHVYRLARTSNRRWMVMHKDCIGRDSCNGFIVSASDLTGSHVWEIRKSFESYSAEVWNDTPLVDWIPVVDQSFAPVGDMNSWPESAKTLANTLKDAHFKAQTTTLLGDRWYKGPNGLKLVWHEDKTVLYDEAGTKLAIGKNLCVTKDWDLEVCGTEPTRSFRSVRRFK